MKDWLFFSCLQLWFCHLPNLKLLTDHIINITAIYSDKSSSYLSSFMLEDICETSNAQVLRDAGLTR